MTAPDDTAAGTDVLDGQLTLDLELLDRTGRAAISPTAAPASDATAPTRTTGQDTA